MQLSPRNLQGLGSSENIWFLQKQSLGRVEERVGSLLGGVRSSGTVDTVAMTCMCTYVQHLSVLHISLSGELS